LMAAGLVVRPARRKIDPKSGFSRSA
jgi:hypothetical protein